MHSALRAILADGLGWDTNQLAGRIAHPEPYFVTYETFAQSTSM